MALPTVTEKNDIHTVVMNMVAMFLVGFATAHLGWWALIPAPFAVFLALSFCKYFRSHADYALATGRVIGFEECRAIYENFNDEPLQEGK
jgi:hypothetical protein